MSLYFFSGKGGVGKTHLATSFAVNKAHSGSKVLLVEFSQKNQYSEYFGIPTGFEPKKFKNGVYLSSWNGKDCLREYVGKILRSQKASDFFMKVSAMERLIDVAPGLKEIAVLGKITSDYRKIDFKTEFDHIVFDCPSSGHFTSLLSVPESLGGIVGLGPMKTQCESILEVLKNPEVTKFILIEDGSKLSENEFSETSDEIKRILPGQKVLRVTNFNKGLKLDSDTSLEWFKHAESQSKHWDGLEW